jgi:hypothetical protein
VRPGLRFCDLQRLSDGRPALAADGPFLLEVPVVDESVTAYGT